MTLVDLPRPSPIQEEEASPAAFERLVTRSLPEGRPLVLRAFAARWRAVETASESDESLCAYLCSRDAGQLLDTVELPADQGGRLFYNEAFTGLNFRWGQARLDATLRRLLALRDDAYPPGAAIQSVPVRSVLPGFEAENPNPILGQAVEPRIWIGNKVRVAPHFDPSENIAVNVAGRRRFTLFPPEALPDLYLGPFEPTPAGTTISLVDLADPDLERFPRFARAMGRALVAELEPGDAIYVPYLWWHGVSSLAPLNMLVNYWWPPTRVVAAHPSNALMHALIALRSLPPAKREMWRAHFDYYGFASEQDLSAHIPEPARGVLGRPTRDEIMGVRAGLAKTLTR